MELSGKKVIIPVEEMFNTHEFWYPYYRLKEAGCEVVVMGSGRLDTYTGKPGTEVTADLNADQVSAAACSKQPSARFHTPAACFPWRPPRTRRRAHRASQAVQAR